MMAFKIILLLQSALSGSWHWWALFGTTWHCSALFGNIRHCSPLFATIRHHLAPFGTIQHCSAPFGCSWVLLGATGHISANFATCSWEPLSMLNLHFVAGEHGLFGGHESEDIRTIFSSFSEYKIVRTKCSFLYTMLKKC